MSPRTFTAFAWLTMLALIVGAGRAARLAHAPDTISHQIAQEITR